MQRNINSAVITGPTGAIGSALCDVLSDNGVMIYAVVRPDSSRISNIPRKDNIKIVECDASNISYLCNVLPTQVDAFFNLAWCNTTGSKRNDVFSQIINISNTTEAVKVASGLGCKIFIGAGSQAEYGRVEGVLKPETPCFPDNAYGMAKLCAGQMSRLECSKLGLDHIWVRILSVYGPNDQKNSLIMSTIFKYLKNSVPQLTPGNQIWDFLYSYDAARALMKLAISGINGKVYTLGSGNTKRIKDYVTIIHQLTQTTVPLTFGELPYSEKQIMYLQADISEIQRDTNWMPEVSFEEGINKTIASVRQEK